IIGFCNEKFYNGELIVMTEYTDDNALQLVTTVPGSHKRGRINQRQVDVIGQEVIPSLHEPASEIGVIAPYRDQVEQIKEELKNTGVDVATVHKFQGREKDVIILSTADDTITEFADNPNLMNVAVSRAKKKLVLVASPQKQPEGSNLGDLIGYMRRHRCAEFQSEISSVFDYLYSEYAESRKEYLFGHHRFLEYDSEKLMYELILKELEKPERSGLGVLPHQFLYLLFRDQSRMNDEEREFVNTGLSHVDFLIYNKVTGQPLLAVEVDGYSYHKKGTRQAERDRIKDGLLGKYGIPLIRFSTNGSQEKIKLARALDRLTQDQ
ncbi:MAG: DUF2726 domain-containing protein, partial [Erysipelotrichaceae bacterium]|nr:DUF2726 domain-containing protein [Erysipelotrichaceae bacterium]